MPPADVAAEKAVLCAIMLDGAVIDSIADQLAPDDFYHPAHGALFRAMLELRDANQPVDLTVLAAHLRSQGQLEAVGGEAALADISDYEATPANVTHYSQLVRDNSVKRGLIGVATEIVQLGYDPGENVDELLDEAESKIFALSQAEAKTTLVRMGAKRSDGSKGPIDDAVDHIEYLMSREGDLTGQRTGYSEFDKLTGGLQPGDLIIIAARPSMGKTALALNIARNAGLDSGRNVAVFSLEMTTRSLVLRMLASEAQVDFSTFHKGDVPTYLYGRLTEAAGRIHDAGIYIDDSGAASVLEIRAKTRRLHAQLMHESQRLYDSGQSAVEPHGVDLVIVDYLQLARGDGRLNSREQEISQISRGLKGLAKELHIPVLALSQLNRGPEQRGAEDKRPMLSDLRESGAIEQDADVIGFIYRDAVYNKDTQYPDQAELIIRKQRNGPTGTVFLKFEGRYARFLDWDQNDYAGQGGGFASSFDGDGPPAFDSGAPEPDIL